MAQLNYQVLKESGYKGYILENAPEKVMQFGEGNFLRAFVDDFIDIANEKHNAVIERNENRRPKNLSATSAIAPSPVTLAAGP